MTTETMNLGTDQNPITKESEGERCYKVCRCCLCGTTRVCSPRFDFYSTDRSGDLLECEDCFNQKLANEGLAYLP